MVSEVRPAVRLTAGAKPVREFTIIPAESSFWVFVGKARSSSVSLHTITISVSGTSTEGLLFLLIRLVLMVWKEKSLDSGLEMKIDTRSLTLLRQ
jgi:hypothetical protein